MDRSQTKLLSSSSSRELQITLWPSLEKTWAHSLPIPELAPMIRIFNCSPLKVVDTHRVSHRATSNCCDWCGQFSCACVDDSKVRQCARKRQPVACPWYDTFSFEFSLFSGNWRRIQPPHCHSRCPRALWGLNPILLYESRPDYPPNANLSSRVFI